jgi:hypothetical protein
MLKTISRTALGAYLTAVKWPIDTAIGVVGRNGGASAAKLSVDRADATIRSLAGLILNDEVLQDDGSRRHAAADERARALRLRAEAAQRTEEADDRLAEREAEADRRREQAAEDARRRREQAEKTRRAKAKRGSEAEQRRKQANARAKARSDEQLEDRAKRSRLEQLDEKSDALERQEQALTARDEAARLRDAAAQTKAARKRRS